MATKYSNVNGALLAEYKQDPRVLMALQAMNDGGSSAPVHTPLEGIARALQGTMGGYMQGKMRDEYQGKQQDQYGAIADILAPDIKPDAVTADLGQYGTLDATPPTIEGSNPNREKIMAALQSGLLDPSIASKRVAQNLGFGEPKDPIKLGKGDRLYAPDDFSKPLVDAAPEPENYNQPFLSDGSPNPAFQEYKMRERAAGKPSTTVNVNADKPFAAALGTGAAGILESSSAAARGGAQTIGTVNQLRAALDTGKVTAGPGTTAIQFFNQVAGGDPQKLQATRATMQGLAKLTLDARGALKGQGTITDREQALLERAVSGDLDNLTIPEIRTVTDVAERAARAAIRANRANVDRARGVPGSGNVVDFYNVEEPAPYAPRKPQSGKPGSKPTVSNW